LNIFDKRLILVAGKGGVGRSTVAAAIAAASARRGRKTLLYEHEANDRYGDFFGTDTVGPQITRIRENLFAVNTNPAAALEEYGLMVLRFKRVYKMVFENRVTRYFLRAIPGLDDYAILGKAWFHTMEEERGRPVWDTVVFDMAASGHSLSMLRIPWVILDTVPEGPLTRDARSVKKLLLDRRRTSLILVTLAEEMPANEARELSEAMATQLSLDVARLVINQVYPDRFPAESPQTAVLDAVADETSGDLAALAAHGRLAVTRREHNEKYIEELRKAVFAPHSELPLLFEPALGPEQIQALSEIVERELGPKTA